MKSTAKANNQNHVGQTPEAQWNSHMYTRGGEKGGRPIDRVGHHAEKSKKTAQEF